eukprot:CAMPEP_0119384258 /NCGR_PEP_ID=MMETSP1334-20130426/84526_1 /TAXON_ID=127549 /ORGANISM="Calcidiscus leptoporus, Strain RCC1130" /LENGTH=31 /DNA_ID= /DNA_START= /DNA_END= /DNA_ORIENTATION=
MAPFLLHKPPTSTGIFGELAASMGSLLLALI